MSFLNNYQIDELKGKLVSDLSTLGKIYKSKKRDFILKSIEHSLVDDHLKDNWEVHNELKTKTTLRKPKVHSKKFEDDIWCQLYDLGYRNLNYDENFELPFSKNPEDKKQIDIIAVDDETILIVECKSAEKAKKAPSYKDEFELLGLRIDGFRKALGQVFGKELKIKYVFATRNLRVDTESDDMKRFKKTNSFYYSDNTFNYVNNLIKNYKGAAHYQFLGLVFKNQLISNTKVEIPAIEGDMGGKKYYMFSIEPDLLLKMGYVLHRTRTNEEDMPNYQRLLVPSRLKGITKFIDDGGYFPNSIIVNFSQAKHKLQFEAASKGNDSSSRFGTLKIPNAYCIAYIIDGQHRLYGYSNSQYVESNTIPVVAFKDLLPKEQLKIFMDINQNQKAVSPSLRLMLSEDLYWNSSRTDSRLIALRSSIIRELSESLTSPLYNKIEIGADPAILSAKPFEKALKDSQLLPKAKVNKYIEDTISGSLYNTSNHDHNSEMLKTKKKIVQLIQYAYEFVEENYKEIYEREKYFILSNRGTYAYVALIGSLNKFLSEKDMVTTNTKSLERFNEMDKYLTVLFDYIKEIPPEEEEKQLTLLGASADVKWLRFFQSIINEKLKDYEPHELIDWRERQDEDLQDKGRKYGIEIERTIKSLIIGNMKLLFDENWDLEIGSIKRKCSDLAEAEVEKVYKENKKRVSIPWTDMFTINDYKDIIKKFWTKMPLNNDDYKTFYDLFSIDIGEEFNSQSQRTKWISTFNSYRNVWAHAGTKDKRLNREEVGFLEMVHSHFNSIMEKNSI